MKLLSPLRLLATASLAIAMSVAAMAQQAVARQFDVSRPDGRSSAVMHLYMPAAEKASGRALLACPGGGYAHLSMENEGRHWADYFCSMGIAYAVLEYTMPKGDLSLPVGDAEWAVRTLRDSALVWNINPYDVGIMGFSAGGHLASTVATHAEWDARPDFCILFYPVITMGDKGQHEGSCRNFLGQHRDSADYQRLYSNDRQVRPHLVPPTVVLLANDDRGVPPVTNGVAFYSAMRQKGNDCALYVYPSGGHGFGFRESFAYHDQMLSDLEGWLRLRKAHRPEAIRVACIGNSITDGHGIDMSDSRGYPALLQQMLGDVYHVINCGVSARCVMNASDHPYIREKAWRDALAFCPDIVVLKLGTNDSKDYNWAHKEDFLRDYQAIVDSLIALPSHPRIILAYPATACKNTWTINDSVISREIIPVIDRVARKHRLETLDLHSVLDRMELMMADGIHPNEKGVKAMAEAVRNKILKEE